MSEQLSTEQKGQIALAKVIEEAGRKGAQIFLPIAQARYDLILDYKGKLFRAQVKYANGKSSHSQGAISLHLRRRKKCYAAHEFDVLLAYLPQLDKICWLGPETFGDRAALYLRFLPTISGQKAGCLMIEDFIW